MTRLRTLWLLWRWHVGELISGTPLALLRPGETLADIHAQAASTAARDRARLDTINAAD